MAMATCEHNVATSYTAIGASGGRVTSLGDIVTLVSRWAERSAQRRHLRELDDHLLSDMGLTRADVEQEASKPFWAS